MVATQRRTKPTSAHAEYAQRKRCSRLPPCGTRPVGSVTAIAVCRRAGISRNAFYLHHASVSALYAALVGELVESIRIESLASAERCGALADKYAAHAEEEMGWVEKFANRILDLDGEVKIEAAPEAKVYDDVVEYLKSEKKVSEEGIAQVSGMMPTLEDDFVAYEDMKAYLIDEDADLQETSQDLDLIELTGLQNWLVLKVTGSEAAAE